MNVFIKIVEWLVMMGIYIIFTSGVAFALYLLISFVYLEWYSPTWEDVRFVVGMGVFLAVWDILKSRKETN